MVRKTAVTAVGAHRTLIDLNRKSLNSSSCRGRGVQTAWMDVHFFSHSSYHPFSTPCRDFLTWCYQTAPTLFLAQWLVLRQRFCNLWKPRRKPMCHFFLYFLRRRARFLSCAVAPRSPNQKSLMLSTICQISLQCHFTRVHFAAHSFFLQTKTLISVIGSIKIAPSCPVFFQTLRKYSVCLLSEHFGSSVSQILSAVQLLLKLSTSPNPGQCPQLYIIVSNHPSLLHCRLMVQSSWV